MESQKALDAQLALERAEQLVGELADEFPRDLGLRRVRRQLREMCDRAEARHLDALLAEVASESYRVAS